MFNRETIIEIHKAIELERRLNKVAYSKIGLLLGYSGEGVNKGLKKHSLSIDQLTKIAKEYNFTESLKLLNPTKEDLIDRFKLAFNNNEIEETFIIDPDKENKNSSIEDILLKRLEKKLSSKFDKLEKDQKQLRKEFFILFEKHIKLDKEVKGGSGKSIDIQI